MSEYAARSFASTAMSGINAAMPTHAGHANPVVAGRRYDSGHRGSMAQQVRCVGIRLHEVPTRCHVGCQVGVCSIHPPVSITATTTEAEPVVTLQACEL